jgi:hypothetical protein
MSKNTKVPEHKLRRDGIRVEIGGRTSNAMPPNGITGANNKLACTASRLSTSAWPFNPQDTSPLAWWRMLPSDLFRDAEHLLLIASLESIRVLGGEEELAGALRGDAAAAVGQALALLPIQEVTLRVDIVMTALLRCALSGDAATALVLANLLHRIELDHPLATDLSASWYADHLRRSPGRHGFIPGGKARRSALRSHDAGSDSDGGAS